MVTQPRNDNLPIELVKHFSSNISYFNKLLSKDFNDINVNLSQNDLKKIEKSFEISHKIR